VLLERKRGTPRPGRGTMFPEGLKNKVLLLPNRDDLAERGAGREVDAANYRHELVGEYPRLDDTAVLALLVLDRRFLLLERVALDEQRPAVVRPNRSADLARGERQGQVPLREVPKRPAVRLTPLPERRGELRPERRPGKAPQLVRQLLGVDPNCGQRER